MIGELIRYSLVGVSTNLFNFGIFIFFRNYSGATVFSASFAAYLIAITYSFFVTNYFVFEREYRRIQSRVIAKYVFVIALSATLQASTVAFLFWVTGFQNTSWVIAALVAAAFNFVALKHLVFIQPPQPRPITVPDDRSRSTISKLTVPMRSFSRISTRRGTSR
jgi:putative flippase GtrA